MAEGPGGDSQGSHNGPSSSEADRQKSSIILCQGDGGLQEDQEKELMELGLPTKICRSWEQGLSQAGEQGLTGEEQSKGRLKSWGWCGKEARETVK